MMTSSKHDHKNVGCHRLVLYPKSADRVLATAAVAPAVQPAVPAAPVLGATTAVGGPVAMPTYRYVYQPDRILVIDPYTNIAVQTIPR